jgi:hypothetical protein
MVATVLLLCAALNASPGPHSLALVDDVSGSAKVVRAAAEKGPAESPIDKMRLVYLFPGDRVTVQPGGRVVVIFFADDHTEELGAGSFTVDKSGCKSGESGAELTRSKPPDYLNSALAQDGWNAHKRGHQFVAGPVIRGGEINPRVVPIRGEMVTTDRPGFSWPKVPDAKEYAVELRAAGGRHLLWKAITNTNSLHYPSGAAPLARRRKYFWEVTVLRNDGTEARHTVSTFTFDQARDPQELAKVRQLATSDRPAQVMIALSAYDHNGMLSDALASCERLAKLVPEESRVWRTLANYYERAGRSEDAKTAIQNAERLEKAAAAGVPEAAAAGK